MKKKFMSRLFLGVTALLSVTALSGCSSEAEEALVVHVLNCEDYIGEDEITIYDEDGNEYTYDDVISAYEEIESEKLGKTVKVVYDTYDTNETMLSSLKTGKSTYELIVASDYTIQKMMSLGMVKAIDKDRVPNYRDYCSPYLREQLEGIEADIDGTMCTVDDYSVGYMWGTLGILYNPEKIASDKGYSDEKIKYDMTDWSSLWSKEYKGEMSVKDSMRDTYSLGVMQRFGDEIRANLESFEYFDEEYNLDPEHFDEAMEQYNPLISEIFNRCDKDTVELIEETLLDLKENIFGFEVDSGKEDMVKGLIGINFAWSGDAVFSMDTAEEPEEESAKRYLYYSVPKTGGNIWFDGWMMGKHVEGELEDATYDLLNFLSDPQIAAANMEYIGYTSFIAGDSILDLVRSWYDPRYYDEEVEVVDAGHFLDEEGNVVAWADTEEYEDWSIVDLTYMFEGTLSEDYFEAEELGDTPETNPYLFYTDELEEIETEDGETCVAGRQFYAQYPPMEMLPKLAIMADYGDNNKYVLNMWQNVKSNNLPLAGVIVFGIILLAGAAIALAYWIGKQRYRVLRVARRKRNARSGAAK